MAETYEEDQAEQKKQKLEIDNAEKKFQNLISKRDELKEEAFLIRDDRDLLNKERKNSLDSIKDQRAKRDDFVARIREHKRKRNNYQKQAKELIASKKDKRNKIFKNLGGEIESLKAEIDYLDVQRQTTPMNVHKENEIIDEMRDKKKDLAVKEKQLPEQDELSAEVMTIDEKIDQLFKKADSEHEKLVKLSAEAQDIFDEINKKTGEISHLIKQANAKHEEYMKIIDRSGYFHERAMEMRNKVTSMRRERRSKMVEARKVIKKQNIEVKKALEDQKKLDAAADHAVKLLHKKGKIEM
jgi:uncharacterized coiled-coil DUF342 family protein